ncbi:alkene reductase [Arthrobacter ginkgonis]|uniref:Alkene reductase n=2 Tax=Arthrobacter ginkgonis TaxID=1630594 RepID=A0ABP7DIE0_9MICC
MPPLTRNRADSENRVTDEMVTYYAQRASAGLLICEGAAVSPQAVAYPGVPGIWRDEHVDAWKKVADAVHSRGGTVFMQLWHAGRVSHPSVQPGGTPPVAPSAVRVVNWKIFTADGLVDLVEPSALEHDEVAGIIQEYALAAENAKLAGFDGVEIHAANGYLIDQFLNGGSNLRADEYGGSQTHRIRFLTEVVNAVAHVWGPDRVGVRISPSATWMDCFDEDKESLYQEVVMELNKFGLAYLHLVEPSVDGAGTVGDLEDVQTVSTAGLASLFDGRVIVTGEHSAESGNLAVQEGTADLVGYGRLFIANPDLPERFAADAPLNTPRREYFYGGSETGFTDYPSLTGEVRLSQIRGQIARGRLTADAFLRETAGTPLAASIRNGNEYAARILRCETSETASTAAADSFGEMLSGR